MISVQKVIFPGIAIGCIFLVIVVSMITSPNIALAANSAPMAVPGANVSKGVKNEVAGVINTLQANGAQAGKTNSPAETAKQNANQIGQCQLSQSYPDSIRQWCSYIMHNAAKNNLDPNLVAAVMLQESGGDAHAYSKSGAVGLLQVMPSDGLASSFMCINGPCFSSRPSTNQLYDPEFNISYGTQMLAGLIQKNGDIREALRAYGPINMGYQYADIILSIFNRYQ